MNKNLETILEEILETSFSHSFKTIADMDSFFDQINTPKIYDRYKSIIEQYKDFKMVTVTHLDHVIFLLHMCSKFTPNTKEAFPSFILALKESYTQNVKSRSKPKFLQQLCYMANSLTNLIYLQFYASPQWMNYPISLFTKLNMFHNLKILSLTSNAPAKLSTYIKIRNTFSKNRCVNSSIEYLFLTNYPLSAIRCFPKLKFLQISAKILIDVSRQDPTIALHKYFHPNALTLNTLALNNTIIIDKTAIHYCQNKHSKIIYNLSNIKVKEGGITNNIHSIEINTYTNTIVANIPSNSTTAYQFIHSSHLQNYSSTTLIPLNISQKPEHISQITQNIPNYTLINVQLQITPHKQKTLPYPEHDHSYHLPISHITSKMQIAPSSNASTFNTNTDIEQTHRNIQASDDSSSHNLLELPTTSRTTDSNSNTVISPKPDIEQTYFNIQVSDDSSHSLLEFPTTSRTTDSNSNTIISPKPDIEQTYFNIQVSDDSSHSLLEFPTTSRTTDSNSNTIISPKPDIEETYFNIQASDDDSSHSLLEFPTTSRTTDSNSNTIISPKPDIEQTHRNIQASDDSSHSILEFPTTSRTTDSNSNTIISPKPDIEQTYFSTQALDDDKLIQ